MKLEHFQPVMDWWNDRKEIEVDGWDKAKKFTVQEIADNNYNLDLCGFPHEEEEILPADELIENYKEKRAYLNKKIDDVLANIEKMLEVKV